MKILVVTYILIFSIQSFKCVFYHGRVKPGLFEYPKLNGWMLVSEAVEKCNNDLACGGFTFKGSYQTRNDKMEVYFFHLANLDKTSNQKKFISLKYFLAKFYYLQQKFTYLNEILKIMLKRNVQYFYWSTYEVDRDFIKISHLKLKARVAFSMECSSNG